MTDHTLITIDGSAGEGGGQILRSALALSAVRGTPIRIENVRAGRRKPGLLRQHLTALRAIQQVSSAEVEGDDIGSRTITFRPRSIRGGDFHFPIGTAGSTTLVLQTVLPALLVAREPSVLIVEGGTHNPAAPPFDFLARCYVPLLRRMGAAVEIGLERHGFFPAGGGRIRVAVQPTPALQPIELLERGHPVAYRARAIISSLPDSVAQRELRVLRSKLPWPDDAFTAEHVPNPVGPGNALVAEVESEALCEVFTQFGSAGTPAEAVARELAQQVRRYLAATAPAGPHLTDQLLLPLALAGGGAFRSTGLTPHAETHIELLRQLLGIAITTTPEDDGVTIRVRPRG
ncbi:MAG: RNA 3'-terminal phosphate cyclase [Planctomycetota bacterium]